MGLETRKNRSHVCPVGPRRRAGPRRGEQGFALVLVAAVLMVITVLGLSAVMFSSGELEGAATSRQRDATRYCAELAMARLAASLADPSTMLDSAIPVFGKDTMDLPTSGGTATYTYWVGHYGQRNNPQTMLKPVDLSDAGGAGGSIVCTTCNITNKLGGGGGSSTMRLFQAVVTCRSPGGTEVELQSMIKRGIE